jgi:hypothetical protein
MRLLLRKGSGVRIFGCVGYRAPIIANPVGAVSIYGSDAVHAAARLSYHPAGIEVGALTSCKPPYQFLCVSHAAGCSRHGPSSSENVGSSGARTLVLAHSYSLTGDCQYLQNPGQRGGFGGISVPFSEVHNGLAIP